MSFAKRSASNLPPSQPTQPTTCSTSETLTPSELESLRRADREGSAYGRKAFEDIRQETRRLRANAKAESPAATSKAERSR